MHSESYASFCFGQLAQLLGILEIESNNYSIDNSNENSPRLCSN